MGKVQLLLSLAVLPKEISVIETSVTLSCTETMTSCTFLANFSREDKTWGWHRNLPLEELHHLFLLGEYNKLTFRCQLTITKIKSVGYRSVLYRYPLSSFTLSAPHHQYEYEWRIQRDALRVMRQSASGKVYQSPVFGDMFVIQIYPNGVEREGSVRVFVQMVAIPPNISKIEAKIELTAPQFGIRWLIVKEFTATQTNWGWGDGLQSIDSLYAFNEVTFTANVEFIELYDDEGRALKNSDWNSSSVRALKVASSQHEMEQNHLVAGYLREYVIGPEVLSNGIMTMISLFARSESKAAVFRRNESPQTIRFKMHRSDPRFVSDIFTFYGLNWMLRGEIHSESKSHIFYRVMLSLVSVPEMLSEVVIGYNLFCPNNQSSISGIRKFSDDDHGADRLRSEYLLVRSTIDRDDDDESAEKEELVSFRVRMHMISMHDKYRDNLYQFPSHLEWKLNPVSSLKKIQIRWNIDSAMMEAIKQSFHGQRFESDKVYDDLFTVGIAPNGLHDEDIENVGYCNMYLSLCSLPSDVCAITIRWTMQCEELGVDDGDLRSHLHLDRCNAISVMFISRTDEFFDRIENVETMTVNVEVEIMQYLDTDGQFNRSFSHVSEQKSARTTRSGGSLRRTSSARTSIEC